MNKVASLIVAYVLLCTTQRVQVLMPLFGVSFVLRAFICVRACFDETNLFQTEQNGTCRLSRVFCLVVPVQ